MFKGAYDILKDKKIKVDINTEVYGEGSEVQGKTGTYISRIYLNVATWFHQCGCRVGTSNNPWGLCKHGIANIVRRFLEENNLKLVEEDEK